MNTLIKKTARRLLPPTFRAQLREPIYDWLNRRSYRAAAAPAALKPGVKLYGLLDEASGMGSASRILALGCQEAELPLSLCPLHSDSGKGVAIEDFAPLCSRENSMNCNLFVFNADCSGAFLHQCPNLPCRLRHAAQQGLVLHDLHVLPHVGSGGSGVHQLKNVIAGVVFETFIFLKKTSRT